MVAILYPFLFAIYPALNLLAQNISQVTPVTVVRPLLASIIVAVILWLITTPIFHDRQKRALFVFFFEVAFFTFGHVLNQLSPQTSPTNLNQTVIYLSLAEIGLLTILAIWLFRVKRPINTITTYLMVVNLCLVAFPMARIGEFYWTSVRSKNVQVAQAAFNPNLGSKPDIYFIVLDSYSRQDLLQKDFSFNNQPFITQLTNLGFQVIPCSRSNYNGTAVSLSSMFNLDYLSDLGIPGTEINAGSNPETAYIKQNLVRTTLEQMGYQIDTFQTDYPTLDWEGVTHIFSPTQASQLGQQLLPIETMFIKSTAIDLLMNIPSPWLESMKQTIDSPYADHIERIRYTLSQLPGTATLPGPKFVYAHLIFPHKPFVLDAQGNLIQDSRYFKDGEPETWELYQKGYIGQIQYANSQMIPILQAILRYSQKPPIIILLGDHGYQVKDTYFENLLAIYLPDQAQNLLYPGLTNVNVFRLIFNQYFGSHYPLLPDASYRIDLKRGYIPAPEVQPGCINTKHSP